MKKFRHLTALLAVCMLAFGLVMLGAPVATGVVIIGLWQLSQMAMSKRLFARCYVSAFTPEQMEEFEGILRGLKVYDGMFKDLSSIKNIPGKFKQLEETNDELRREITRMKKTGLAGVGRSGVTWVGPVPFVTDDCAKTLTAIFVCGSSRLEGALESMLPDESTRTRILSYAAGIVGIGQRAGGALTTGDIPLPTVYVPQIVELVFAYGQARKFATLFPLGAGTVKLPKLRPGVLARELSRIEGQVSYMKTRYNIVKAKFPLPQRQLLAAAQAVELGQEMIAQKAEHVERETKRERRRGRVQRFAQRTGILTPENAPEDTEDEKILLELFKPKETK